LYCIDFDALSVTQGFLIVCHT